MVQTQEKSFTPLNDVLFKKVFATQANSHIIMGFLKDVGGINAESVKVIDPYNVDIYFLLNNHLQPLNFQPKKLKAPLFSDDYADNLMELYI